MRRLTRILPPLVALVALVAPARAEDRAPAAGPAPSSGAQTPSSRAQTPASSGAQTPASSGAQTPASSGAQTPASGAQTPSSGAQTSSASGAQTPSAGAAAAPTSDTPLAPVDATHGEVVCADDLLVGRLVPLLRGERFADLHHAATTARVLCTTQLDGARLLDAIALVRLEDRPAAYAELVELQQTPMSERARLVLGWAYRSDRDVLASDAVLSHVPAPRAAAIRALAAVDDRDDFSRHLSAVAPDLRTQALALQSRYDDAHTRSPAFAGILTAILPGAGQLYAGSLQAAAVTFVLNGLFIAATVELTRDEKYFTAAAAGTAASFFYVGGIMNAVDLARRRNERASEPSRAALEKLLVPELDGHF
jgi:hypothetical protein